MPRTVPAPVAEPDAAAQLDALDAVQRRVLWLATEHGAPRQQGARDRLRREGRRPSGLLGVDRLDHDGALLRAPAGARPRLGQAARRAGAACDQLPARHARRVLPDDAARVRRAAELSEPREGSRPGRLLDRLGRHRRDGDDLERARAPLRRRSLRGAARRSRGRAGRRRRARRGCDLGSARRPDGRRAWARSCGSSTSTASRSTASCRTSPPAASARCSRRPAGRRSRSSTAGGCARCSSCAAARRCARGSTGCPTRSTSGCCAARPSSCASGCRARDADGARSSGSCASSTTRRSPPRCAISAGTTWPICSSAFRRADAVNDRPTVIFAYTIKAWGLPTEGHPGNHSALLSDEQWQRARRRARRRRRRPLGALRRRTRPRQRLCREAAARLAREPVAAARPPVVPGDLGRAARRHRIDAAELRPLLHRPRARRARGRRARRHRQPRRRLLDEPRRLDQPRRRLEPGRAHRLVRRRLRHARALARVGARPAHRARHRRGQPRRPARRARRDLVARRPAAAADRHAV